MATSVTIGGTTYTPYSKDGSYVQTAVTLPSAAVKTAFNDNKPMIITELRTYVGSYDLKGNIVASIGGFSGTFNNVAIDSSPGLSAWLTLSGSIVYGGTSTNFRLNPSTEGGLYFKRSGSGSTTQQGTGYTWAGTAYCEYRYIESPDAPTSFLATPSGTSGVVNFTWAAPADDGGSNVTGYDIYRGTTSTAITTLIGSTAALTFSYTAPNNTLYYYDVRAKNEVTIADNTTSKASSYATATANFAAVVGNPTNMVATPNAISGRIDLTWSPPASVAGNYGYKIYQNGVLIQTIAISSDPAETFSVTGLSPGLSYSFYVTSITSTTESGSSNTATATAPGFAAAPSALAVTSIIATTVLASIEVPKQLRLSWTAPAGMTNTGGYKIYRDGVQIAGVGVAGSIVGNMTNPSYIDSSLTLNAGTSYTYTIRAYLVTSTEVGSLTAPVSGIPVDGSIQEVTDTVANLTNAEFDGTYDNLVTVINPTTFSYPVTGGTAYSVQSVDSGFGTVSEVLLPIFGSDYPIATAAATSFTFALSSLQPSTTAPIGISSTVTNKTNATLSGNFTVDSSTSTPSSTVYYSVTGAVLGSNITTVATGGTANSLDASVFNATTTAVVLVPTASSFTYSLPIATDQAEAVTTGTVTVPANKNLYNAVDKIVTSIPRYDTVVYATTVPASGATNEDVALAFPEETARRTSSTASAEIEYRSGWIG